MSPPYTHISDLASQAQPPEDGILSRTVYNDERVKAVVFGFAAGEELSEHTASMPAIVQVLTGEARLCLTDRSATILAARNGLRTQGAGRWHGGTS